MALEALGVACIAGVSTSILSVLATSEPASCFGVLALGCRGLPLEEILFSSSSSILVAGCCFNFGSAARLARGSLGLTSGFSYLSSDNWAPSGFPRRPVVETCPGTFSRHDVPGRHGRVLSPA